MNRMLLAGMLLAAIAIMASPATSYALTTHKNFIWGADSVDTGHSNQKGAQTTVEIQIGSGDHTFDVDEDHNFHVEAKDNSNSRHLAGYFVADTATTTAKFFAEHWWLDFVTLKRDMNFEASGSISGGDGSVHTFTVYKPSGSWSYILDGTSQTQYTGSKAGTVLDASDIWALAEKVCPTTACDKNQVGDMPTTRFTKAMEYKDGSWWFTGTWNAVDDADAYYQTKSADSTGTAAKDEMCAPMSMKGNVQSGGPSGDNVMDILDGSNTFCTGAGNSLWLP